MDSGESIYHLIPDPVIVPPKPAMHKSMHAGKIDPHDFYMGVPTKREKGSFGPADGQKPPAGTFLKSGSGAPPLPTPAAPTVPKEKLKAPVPTEKPVMGLVSGKNYITANAVENILSAPKGIKPEPMRATSKPDYGKVPTYLKTIKGAIDAEKEMIEEQHRQAQMAAAAGSMMRMGEEDKEDLMVELKLKWQRVNEAYQKLPFTLDTPMRRMRKEKYEAELTQLEKDIETLGRKTVLIDG